MDGFIITSSEKRTSVNGLFAVGGCVNKIGQIAIAAGQAALAAITLSPFGKSDFDHDRRSSPSEPLFPRAERRRQRGSLSA